MGISTQTLRCQSGRSSAVRSSQSQYRSVLSLRRTPTYRISGMCSIAGRRSCRRYVVKYETRT